MKKTGKMKERNREQTSSKHEKKGSWWHRTGKKVALATLVISLGPAGYLAGHEQAKQTYKDIKLFDGTETVGTSDIFKRMVAHEEGRDAYRKALSINAMEKRLGEKGIEISEKSVASLAKEDVAHFRQYGGKSDSTDYADYISVKHGSDMVYLQHLKDKVTVGRYIGTFMDTDSYIDEQFGKYRDMRSVTLDITSGKDHTTRTYTPYELRRIFGDKKLTAEGDKVKDGDFIAVVKDTGEAYTKKKLLDDVIRYADADFMKHFEDKAYQDVYEYLKKHENYVKFRSLDALHLYIKA